MDEPIRLARDVAIEVSAVDAPVSFEAFIDDHHARLFGALCLVTGDRFEAEEIVQDAFVRVYEKWDRVSGLEDPTGYLYRTAMNVFRKRYRRAALALRRAVVFGPPADDLAAIEDREVVLRGLAAVTRDQRAALVATALLGFSSEEAGRVLGAKASTIRARATRARAALREAIGARMIDDKELLERAMRQFSPEPGMVERVMRRHDRKRRNRRIGSALLALIIAFTGIAGAFAAFRPGEPPPITPTNVSDVRLLGSVPLDGGFAVSDGLVYVGNGETHELEAYPTSCYSVKDPCGPTWVAHLGSAPRVIGAAGGNVYVSTDAVYAFSASCGTGGATCQPTWVGAIPGRRCDGCLGEVTLGPDTVYVLGSNRLFAFPMSCTGRCSPAWVAKMPARVASMAASSDIVVVAFAKPEAIPQFAVKPDAGLLMGFPAHCATDGSVCPPSGIWREPTGVGIYPVITPDVIAEGEIFVSGEGTTWVYPTSCAVGRDCRPLWSVPFDGQLVVVGNKAFISTDNSVMAFPIPCDTPCEPLWHASYFHSGAITVANGLLFGYNGVTCHRCFHTHGIYAFPTRCGTGDAECKPAWTWGTTGNLYADQLVVTNNRVYAATGTATGYDATGTDLSVFGIDPSS